MVGTPRSGKMSRGMRSSASHPARTVATTAISSETGRRNAKETKFTLVRLRIAEAPAEPLEKGKGRSLLCQCHSIERGLQSGGEFDHVIVCPEVHEEQNRLVIEHVIVQGGDLDAIVVQNTQHRIDFTGGA